MMQTGNGSGGNVIDGHPEAEDNRLIENLDRVHLAELPSARDRLIEVVLQRHMRERTRSLERPGRTRGAANGLRRRFLLPAIAVALALLAVSLALAAGAIINLGKPTNDTADVGPPIGGFRYIKTSLSQNQRPELLFLTVPGSMFTDPEGWPLVKALEQFGSLSGLSSLPPAACGSQHCAPPGFEFGHVRYRSRYLAFASREILDFDRKPFQHLSPPELTLFNRYANPHDPGPQDYFTQAGNAANVTTGSRRLPLIAVGGYLQTESNFVTAGDFVTGQATPPNGQCCQGEMLYASFADAQQSLATGKPVGGLQPSMIRDVNIETNIITALICHADGLQPKAVCGRQVIKHLLRKVK